MLKPTKFLLRTSKISRLQDFYDHLRNNGFNVSLEDLMTSLRAIRNIDISCIFEWKNSLKAVFSYNLDSFERFDEIFNSFWLNQGRKKVALEKKNIEKIDLKSNKKKQNIFLTPLEEYNNRLSNQHSFFGNFEANEFIIGNNSKLIASSLDNKNNTDLKEFFDKEEQNKISETIFKIARAIRHKRSRRLKINKKGKRIDLKKIVKKSISYGGDPVTIFHKNKIQKPMKIVGILDISGSMKLYSYFFLIFLKGLMGIKQSTDVYLFHTKLMRVTDYLKDKDTLRAVKRISLLTEGFSGGTKIGKSLKDFNIKYSKKMVNGKTLVMIISDGYDTGDPKLVSENLSLLKKRNCKIIWLNPLLGWEKYEPLAKSMVEALKYLDFFAPCNTIKDLEKLESELCQI